MNIAYFGSPHLSAALLTQLIEKDDLSISLVVTQPNKPAGKRLEMLPTAVKLLAQKHTIEVFDEESFAKLPRLLEKKHIDLCIVFAYGRIIPSSLLAIPKHGFWNIHPSLLPLYRGPAPIIYPLILGAHETGVTLMRMDAGLDTGDIIAQEPVALSDKDTKISLSEKLISLSLQMIMKAVDSTAHNELLMKKQKNENATYSRLLKKSDGYIAPHLIQAALEGNITPSEHIPEVLKEYWNTYEKDRLHRALPAAVVIHRLYKGLHPWPGLWTNIKYNNIQLRVKLLELKVANNMLIIDQIQVEGKKPIDFATFKKAYNIFT